MAGLTSIGAPRRTIANRTVENVPPAGSPSRNSGFIGNDAVTWRPFCWRGGGCAKFWHYSAGARRAGVPPRYSKMETWRTWRYFAPQSPHPLPMREGADRACRRLV